jgi:hypothetical protein
MSQNEPKCIEKPPFLIHFRVKIAPNRSKTHKKPPKTAPKPLKNALFEPQSAGVAERMAAWQGARILE